MVAGQLTGPLAVLPRQGSKPIEDATPIPLLINAISVPDFDRARVAARTADQARARGEDGRYSEFP